ncbi:MAG: aminotransferase class V-fold PLP-dependent enzyme [Chloroflexi bacterium]|nr:aminotransferase class V-fold PLP-dependent enzyme [Chloroflexota bacterium]
MVDPFQPDTDKLAAVRAALPALGAGIYLNTGSVGPLPAETAAAMAEITDYELRIGRAHPDYMSGFLERLDEARGAVAAVLGADIAQVAITHSTSTAMNSAIGAVALRPGERIVTTRSEHPAAVGPVLAAAERDGATAIFVDLDDATTDEEILRRFDEAIVPGTRLVAFSHVLWTTGRVLPVAAIGRLAHERGAVVVVDGAQAAGAIRIAVHELEADFYAAPGQKWLLGPEATAALWVSPAVVATARPTLVGWFNYEKIGPDGGRYWPDARRFDGTQFHKASISGFARSCGWLSMYVGLTWIHERGAAMAARAADRLAGITGVEVLTPRDRMATLVTFRIGGWTPDEALAELSARTFAIARTIPPVEAIRFSIGFFTTEDEIERVASAVELLAAHTPVSLPPRPRLTVLGQGSG